MLQEPELTSPLSTTNSVNSLGPASGPAPKPAPEPAGGLASARRLEIVHPELQRVPRWLQLIELFLRVLLRILIGLALFYAPWSGDIPVHARHAHGLWNHNPLFETFPTLAAYAANGAVRGVVSGLGLLNLWFAFADVRRYGAGKR
jgi:hypothetical protein